MVMFAKILILFLHSPSDGLRPEIADLALEHLANPCGHVPGSYMKQGWTRCICDTHLNKHCGPQYSERKEFDPAGVPASGCKCLTPWESRMQSREAGKSDITNTALQFCSGLFMLIEEHLPKGWPAHVVHPNIKNKAEAALRKPQVQKICETAVTGDVDTNTADKEVYFGRGASAPPPTDPNLRVVQLFGPQTEDSWRELLKNVCKDECHFLVGNMSKYANGIGSGVAVAGRSIPEMCSDYIVKPVEANILSCCEKSCGWHEGACRYWPLMDKAEQENWNARCCSIKTVLHGSERAELCNSVVPSPKLPAVEKLDTKPKGSDDSVRVGQDSFLQSLEQVECTDEGLKKCPETDLAQAKQLCSKSHMKWQYLMADDHANLVDICGGSSEEMKLEDCSAEVEKMEKKGGSVSWKQGTCWVLKCDPSESSEIYGKSIGTFNPEQVSDVVLFKEKPS